MMWINRRLSIAKYAANLLLSELPMMDTSITLMPGLKMNESSPHHPVSQSKARHAAGLAGFNKV
ncbi:hypothetical protein HMF8227_01472 [Saliniradius amylolyticus]|uniref:Uncharacterized protein n=1 Tax=Saliniradius amylolyticus TaxID=2183582 RepID=A0A2S2E4M2_9ALTE|nr:hypothetical protein HMF8227_01472 [Saliniradius amylolyticus]